MPGKLKGPTSNLQTIIRSSVLRKKLSACIKKKINLRSGSAIPISRAAYRKNMSTTDHVFASTYKTVYLPLLDMNKAFGSMQRNTLIEELKKFLNEDELHLIQILLDVTIAANL